MGREEHRLLRDLDEAVPAADPAAGATSDHGLGVRREVRPEQPRPARPQRALAHHRGEVEQTRPGEVDQRAGRRRRQLPAPPAPSRSDTALPTRPGVWTDGTHGWISIETRSLHGPGSHRHACSRCSGRRRRQRRLRGGVVLARRERHPGSHARKGAGTASSPARPPRPTASPGDVASRPSSTRIRTGHRRSGTTITRSA